MKVEIVQSDSISELDKLINACIQNRKVNDIKLSTVTKDESILYTSLIMLDEEVKSDI
ncbi:hypothetical protein [Candidatus Nitrosopumilus sp. SW]|uniref:hypothetical protein n=1 Tax=Candidatus Nitrosopumilus sp. SW TaxID=2508726 RepID=UPI00163ADE08|nr:hypothetical protein [Candidatus Nitrosopumilus sp. SW]